MNTDPETLSQKLQQILGSKLRSIILYGSSVAGDYVDKRSNLNLLIVVDDLSLSTLKELLVPFSEWTKAGKRPPLLFTPKRLQQSADVFPIELFDLKDQRKVLFGEDLIASLDLTSANLRLQLESELKGKLISLREGYFACLGKPKELLELVVNSLSSFQVLMRAALRLFDLQTPASKEEAVALLASRISFDTAPFETAAKLKDGRLSPKSLDGEALFASYLSSVGQLVDLIDSHES